MMRKRLFFGTALVLTVLFIMQATTVYAGKPEQIYWHGDDLTVVDSNFIHNDDGTVAIMQVDYTGTLYTPGGFFVPDIKVGDFEATLTGVPQYQKDGAVKIVKQMILVVITTDLGDTLTINVKNNWDPSIPTDFQSPGSWVIVDGTGLMAAVSGRGEYVPSFQFLGRLK